MPAAWHGGLMAARVPEVDVRSVPADFPEGLVVLDVREDDEWEAGHIDGAVHIPMRQVPARLGDVPDAERVLVVCRVGSRSALVTGFLRAQGRNAVNLAGGMAAWQVAGRPMRSDTPAGPRVI
jgi:rhodanese-related sulfurtransferase